MTSVLCKTNIILKINLIIRLEIIYYIKLENRTGFCLTDYRHQVPSSAGCHNSPLLPILSQSHEVFVSHSRPFCDVGHPLRYWPSSAYFPLQWTLQQQPVDVVTSDHVTKVGNSSFLYCWNYVMLFVYHF